jgi:protocatechuate 3,4-dioxygenase beta subunit
MRGLVLVLTVAFVFAAGPLLISQVVGQSSSSASLVGRVCQKQDYAYDASQPVCNYGPALPDAHVYLTQPGPVSGVPAGATNRSATSDSNGAYTFSSVPVGDYSVVYTHAGFATEAIALTLSAGKNSHDEDLAPTQVTVSGVVSKAADGKALPDAQLMLCCSSDGSQASGASGSDGKFSLQVRAGWMTLSAHRSGYQDVNLYQLFDGSAPVDVAMEAIPPQDASLHGIVLDQYGAPVAAATVAVNSYGGPCCYAYAESGTTTTYANSSGPASDCYNCGASSPARPYYGGQNSTTTDAKGHYSMHVYSGQMGLNVYKEGYASISMTVQVDSGSDTAQDLTLQKFPAKTAHLAGRVTDLKTGKGLGLVQISLQSPEFGLNECSTDANQPSSSGSPPPQTMGAGSGIAYPYPGPYNSGCAITVRSDGTFSGDVTPGYAIIQVTFEQWLACSDTTDADGSSTHTCGPEYNSWSTSLGLPANETTRVNVALHQRPSPDAVVSGYLLDSKSGLAIAGAQISFSNEDAQGYGYATTDQDGSYKLRLRSGYHQVYASAPNHLHWQGTLDVKSGETPFDVPLVPGQESYGGCCYYPGMEKGMAPMPASAGGGYATYTATASSAPGYGAPGVASDQASGSAGASGGTGAQYQDLGGGLGPYNAAERGQALAGSTEAPAKHGSPAPGVLLSLAAVALVVAARRRLA